MQTLSCATCTYEFDTPVFGASGPSCPRCGDPATDYPKSEQPAITSETYFGAIAGGVTLGLIAAALLMIVR
jgi:hypothetical protein